MSYTFSPIAFGSLASFSMDESVYASKLDAGRNGLALIGLANYRQVDAPVDERLVIELPVLAVYDSEFNVGIFIEFADGVLTEEQIKTIAGSVRFGRLAEA